MNDLISFISSINHQQGLIYLVLLIAAIIVIIKNLDFIVQRFGIKTKRMLREEEQDKDIKELKGHAKKTDEDVDKIIQSIGTLQESVDKIFNQVNEMQRRSNENEMNVLRDRIGQSYRYYRQKQHWNHMEKEAFNGLITAYEQAGGTNGFVHEICIPESMKWDIVDE